MKVIVAVVQQMMRVHETPDEYQADVKRFMRQVKSKQAHIVVFPELSGLMLAYPLISGVKLGLLKRADRGRARRASPLTKVLGRAAGTTAGALGGGMRGSLDRLLQKRYGELFDLYVGFFSEVAAEYGMYVVAGSVYLYDEDLDDVRNVCYVFGPNGEIVGYQEKLVLTQQDEGLCSPGDRLAVLPTDLGRLGVIVGSDVLYPEPARALAVQGADFLVAPAACPGYDLAQKVRGAFQARVEENQLFGVISFLVGPNSLGTGQFMGRSAVLAPIELTARRSGALQEAGAANVETFVTTECDPETLHALWETSDPPLRHRMPQVCGQVLADFYRAGLTISQGQEAPESVPERDVAVSLPEVGLPGDVAAEVSFQDELPDTQMPVELDAPVQDEMV